MSAFLIFVLVLALLALVTVAAGVKTVPQGQQWTVERFGRYRTTIFPGLNLIIPYVDTIGRKVNVQETVLPIASQLVITKDNASVTVDGIVFYQVLDAGKAAYEVQNLEQAITNITMTNIRTAIGALDLDETLSKRDEINDRLLHVLDAASEPWGTKVTRVELKDVRPPEDVVSSMAKQLTGRAREARRHPPGRRREAGGDPQGRGREAIANPRRRGPPGRGQPRRRGARAPGPGRGRRHRLRLQGRHRGQRAGAQLFRGAEICRGDAQIGRVARTRAWC